MLVLYIVKPIVLLIVYLLYLVWNFKPIDTVIVRESFRDWHKISIDSFDPMGESYYDNVIDYLLKRNIKHYGKE
jgi:hypothetical protein